MTSPDGAQNGHTRTHTNEHKRADDGDAASEELANIFDKGESEACLRSSGVDVFLLTSFTATLLCIIRQDNRSVRFVGQAHTLLVAVHLPCPFFANDSTQLTRFELKKRHHVSSAGSNRLIAIALVVCRVACCILNA